MESVHQQIDAIEKEIRETPYHKGTEHHIGKLRARLAKLKDRLIEGTGKGGGAAGGYAIRKQGDATVVLIGPPSAGKSTLINKITNAQSKVAPYAFTTVSVIPGMLKYKDAYIQILDVPGLIEGAKEGKGRGKEILSMARGADLLLILVDIERQNMIDSLVEEIEGAGIRVNKTPPDIVIEKKGKGGIIIHSNVKQAVSKDTIKAVAMEYGLRNAEVTIKEKLTLEKLIDAFSPNRVYLPALFAVNKVDLSPSSKNKEDCLYISAEKGTGINELKEAIWQKLGLVRVFLVRPGEEPSFNHPVVVRKKETLSDVSLRIGSEFAEGKTKAKIWGSKAKFPGQEVSLSTPVSEGLQVRFL